MAVDRWRLHETQQSLWPCWKFYMYTVALFRIWWRFSYTHSFSLRVKWQHINVCSSSPTFFGASPGCWILYEEKLLSATEALPVCLLQLRTAYEGPDNLWVWWECRAGTDRRTVLQESWSWVGTGGCSWALTEEVILYHCVIIVSVWLLRVEASAPVLRVRDSSSVAPVEHNA